MRGGRTYRVQDRRYFEFWEKQQQWTTQKTEKVERTRGELERQEIKICSFVPQINSWDAESPISVSSRLYQIKNDYSVLKNSRDAARAEDELRQCTFSPMINESSRSVRSRLFHSRSPSIWAHGRPEDCSFSPCIIQPKETMKTIQEYLQKDPFERLSVRKPHPEASCLSIEGRETASVNNKFYQRISLVSFLERQHIFETMKTENQVGRIPVYTHKPNICPLSRKLAKSDFFRRNVEFLCNSLVNKVRISAEARSKCTFHPQIHNSRLPAPKQFQKKWSSTLKRLQILSDPATYLRLLRKTR